MIHFIEEVFQVDVHNVIQHVIDIPLWLLHALMGVLSPDEIRSCMVWNRIQTWAWSLVPRIAVTIDPPLLEFPAVASFHCSWGWKPRESVELSIIAILQCLVLFSFCSREQIRSAQLRACRPRLPNPCSASHECVPLACFVRWSLVQSSSLLTTINFLWFHLSQGFSPFQKTIPASFGTTPCSVLR